MSGWYLDTSAAVKLVVRERHSAALRDWTVRDGVRFVGSDLTRAEFLRVARRRGPVVLDRALQLWEKVDAVAVTPALFREAATLDPPDLRTLDALHLAVALDLGDGIAGVATYDVRLADAAASFGLAVAAPGA